MELWNFLSVCLSHLFDNVPVMVPSWNFQEWLSLTMVMFMQKVKCQRSKVKVTEVKTQFSHLRTVTPVWIHIWPWNDAQGLMLLRRELFFKIICQISRSQGTKKPTSFDWIGHFRTVASVKIHWWLWNDAQSLKYCRRGSLLYCKVICQISRSHTTKNVYFHPNCEFLDSNSSLN